MIAHVVLLKPRADLSAADRLAFVAAFERAAREIPTVRGARLGKRVAHGADYERGMPDTADLVAILDFEDVAGLQAYLGHPAHAELGTLFGRCVSAAAVYDFEVRGLDALDQVVSL